MFQRMFEFYKVAYIIILKCIKIYKTNKNAQKSKPS